MTYPLFAPGLYQAGQRCTYEEKVYEKIKTGKVTVAPRAGSTWKLITQEEGIKTITDAFFQSALVMGKIDMAKFLVGDGLTDNAERWAAFQAYTRKKFDGKRVFSPVFYEPYFFGETLDFSQDRYDFHLHGNAEFLFSGRDKCFQFRCQEHEYYHFQGPLNIRALSRDDQEGLIDPSNPAFLDFLGRNRIPHTIRDRDGVPLSDYIEHKRKIYSFNPDDYESWGIYSTTVLKIPEPNVSYCAAGIFLNAPAIGLKTEEAPAGYNCSMSYLGAGLLRANNGPGIAIFGADANHITLERTDTREGGSVGIIAMSQSDTVLIAPHSAVNAWGDYLILDNGDSAILAPYSENNKHCFSLAAGQASILGGPLKAPIAFVNGAPSYQHGASISGLDVTGARLRGNVYRPGNDNYFSLLEEDMTGGNGVGFHERIGGEEGNQGISTTTGVGVRGLYGRVTDYRPVKSFPFGFVFGNNRWFTVGEFAPPATARFFVGDELRNSGAAAHQIKSWRITSPGWAQPDGYERNVNILLEPSTESPNGNENLGQYLRTVTPTNYFGVGDEFYLNGRIQWITQQPQPDSQGRQVFPSGQQHGQSGPVMPVFGAAKFEAQGSATGTLEQREALHDDRYTLALGFTYWLKEKPNSLTATKQEWNGAEWL